METDLDSNPDSARTAVAVLWELLLGLHQIPMDGAESGGVSVFWRGGFGGEGIDIVGGGLCGEWVVGWLAVVL